MNQELNEKENKEWIDKDGIVNIRISKIITVEGVYEIIDNCEKFLREAGGKGKILINIIPYKGPFIATSEFRKIVSERIKKVIKDPGFKKVAVLGGNIIIRTVVSFIITASGVKYIKVFNTQEKALKWLKE